MLHRVRINHAKRRPKIASKTTGIKKQLLLSLWKYAKQLLFRYPSHIFVFCFSTTTSSQSDSPNKYIVTTPPPNNLHVLGGVWGGVCTEEGANLT